MRADVLLVEQGLAPSRTRAQELIATGKVIWLRADGQRTVIKKPSQIVNLARGESLVVDSDAASPYVSRGGVKMKGALQHTQLKVDGYRILDVGISTGGFSDCLLQEGAKCVVGVDVGHGQLHERLKTDARVRLVEGVNARDLSKTPLRDLNEGQGFDLVVIDVSFISLTLVLPGTIQYLRDSGSVLALVKPQFEVGRENLGKNGIVKDTSHYARVEAKIRQMIQSCGLIVEDYFASPIEGSDGNREFFVWARSPELSLSLGARTNPDRM